MLCASYAPRCNPRQTTKPAMPIYAYKCSACGHTQDVLQKISAEPLTECPACGKATYAKQVTAPQFQLKGSGWYVTDFRGGNSAAPAAEAKDAKDSAAKAETKADAKTESKTDSATTTSAPSSTPATTPAAPAKAASAASE